MDISPIKYFFFIFNILFNLILLEINEKINEILCLDAMND